MTHQFYKFRFNLLDFGRNYFHGLQFFRREAGHDAHAGPALLAVGEAQLPIRAGPGALRHGHGIGEDVVLDPVVPPLLGFAVGEDEVRHQKNRKKPLAK